MDAISRVACITGGALLLPLAGLWAQPASSQWEGVPEQVIPSVSEVGAPRFVMPPGQGGSVPGQPSGSISGDQPVASGGNGSALQALMAQSYGQTAIDTANQLGISPDAIAGFGQLESGFRNIATANGSSSATGPWQITSGTFNDVVSRYNLLYTAADRTNPEAQAVIANYIIRDYSAQVSQAIGQPASVQQVYSAFVFGPGSGTGIAGAGLNEPLSKFASPQALANNNMTGWTVGQFYNRVSSKLGPLANQPVGA